MLYHRIRFIGSFALCTAVLAVGTSAIAQVSSHFLQLNGNLTPITCNATGLNVPPGLTAAWDLTASTQVMTTITAGGILVEQNVKPLPSATGTFPLGGAIDFPNPVAMPYTLVYALTPQVPGAGTSAVSVDCVGGTVTNFKILNSPPFTSTSLAGYLENPQIGAPESGVGLISGWACNVSSVQVLFDDGAKIPKTSVPYGSPRADTATVCGTNINSGFGLLFNYNTLGPGTHMVTLYVNGNVQIGSAPFVVSTTGVEFLTGAQATINVPNFPVAGKSAALAWQQANQNFAITSTAGTPPSVTGNYQGAFIGTATGCGSSGSGPFSINNVQFAMTQTGDAVTIMMTTPNSTPSSCTLNGTLQYNVGSAQHRVSNGNYACNDGTSGTWNVSGLAFNGGGFTGTSTFMTINGCTSTARHAGARTN